MNELLKPYFKTKLERDEAIRVFRNRVKAKVDEVLGALHPNLFVILETPKPPPLKATESDFFPVLLTLYSVQSGGHQTVWGTFDLSPTLMELHLDWVLPHVLEALKQCLALYRAQLQAFLD